MFGVFLLLKSPSQPLRSWSPFFRHFVSFEFTRHRHFHGRHTVAILCHLIFYSTYHETTAPMWEPATPQNLRVLKNPPCTRSIFRQSTDGSEYLTAEVNIFGEEQHMLRKLKRSIPSSTRSRPCKRPARSRVDCCRGASMSATKFSTSKFAPAFRR